MGRFDEELSRLGRRLDDEHDELLRRRPRDPGERERFLAAALALRATRPRRLVTWGRGAAAFAAVAAAVLLFVALARGPLTFRVGAGEATEAGVPGAWIATPAEGTTSVRFSEGTLFQIQPQSRLRVASVDPAGGRLVLENGAVHAAVVHRADTRWLVDSGPFEVLVTGTRFTVQWNPAAEELVIALDEGSVAVSGPIIGERFAVRAGQTLRVRQREGQFELRRELVSPTLPLPPPGDAAVDPTSGPGDDAGGAAVSSSPLPVAASAKSTQARAPRQSWRELEAAGKFKEAIVAADREGFGRICSEGSAADLRDLADAARLSGDIPRSILVLTTLRRRFPGGDQAAESAYLLGVIAFDGRGAPAESAPWFTTYLNERPRGRLAREAAGRLLEAEVKSGNHARAGEAARRYLRDYPGGPHAEMAKALVGQ